MLYRGGEVQLPVSQVFQALRKGNRRWRCTGRCWGILAYARDNEEAGPDKPTQRRDEVVERRLDRAPAGLEWVVTETDPLAWRAMKVRSGNMLLLLRRYKGHIELY